MKLKHEFIFTIFAFIVGAALVIYVSPHARGFWGNTFFEIKYPIAYYFTPFSTAFVTYISSRYWYKKRGYKTNHIRTGILITITAFYLYGIAHSIMVGLTSSLTIMPYIFFAYIAFGSIIFLPVCIIFGALSAMLAKKLNYSNKALQSDA